MKTNKDIKIQREHYELDIPMGASVEYSKKCNCYFLSPSNFTGMDKHDATYYGFRVKEEDIEK